MPSSALMAGLALGAALRDEATAEALLRDCDLDWTIVHAALLTKGPAKG